MTSDEYIWLCGIAWVGYCTTVLEVDNGGGDTGYYHVPQRRAGVLMMPLGLGSWANSQGTQELVPALRVAEGSLELAARAVNARHGYAVGGLDLG